ncbi:MAG: hypothetical protein KDD38_00760 [Bdellovibrionales bacterium]|nr:hypothetical protein [Bdellovibrionales bacterium]
MKGNKIFLIILMAVTFGRVVDSRADVYRRNNTTDCIATNQIRLDIPTELEAREVCENYPDDVIDCAVYNQEQYGGYYEDAIQLCILKYSDTSLQNCALKTLRKNKSTDSSTDIGEAMADCRSSKPVPRSTYSSSPAYPVQTEERNQYVPKTATRPPIFMEKIADDKITTSLAQWLNILPTEINGLTYERFHKGCLLPGNTWCVNSAIEDLTLSWNIRKPNQQARLYKVNFVAKDLLVECVGSDYGVGSNEKPNHFALHGCHLENNSEIQNVFSNLDYSFENEIDDAFKKIMKSAANEPGGPGVNRFNRHISEYVVITY